MIKFKSKTENYKSPRADRGFFPSPYVVAISAKVNPAIPQLIAEFRTVYEVDGNVIEIESSQKVFDATYIPTTILNESDAPEEILAFLTRGGQYNEERIAEWGQPDFNRAIQYFIPESIWTGLTLAETPFKQLAIDWIKNVIKVEGVFLKVNFEFEVEQ
ncbi:MAG: hypothetical protein JJE55_08315 [Flavobacteriaceae bacterium]|nr:hypothetical protein [Flavobacteriaceae bacterium]